MSRRLYGYLFLGVLSSILAETYSSSSPLWPLDVLGWLIIYPLYTLHTIFLLSIALHTKKATFEGLYVLGMIFGLYESWITKVLWMGYMESGKPIFPPVFGIAYMEFLILVLYWHAIMSFIAPILLYQIFTGRIISTLKPILRRKRWKTILIAVYLSLLGSLISKTLSGNYGQIILSLMSNIFLVIVLLRLADRQSIDGLCLTKNGITKLGIVLAIFYIITSLILRFEAFPKEPISYITILLIYAGVIYLYKKLPEREFYVEDIDDTVYNPKEALSLMLIPWITALIYSLFPQITEIIANLTYLSLTILGIPILIYILYKPYMLLKTL